MTNFHLMDGWLLEKTLLGFPTNAKKAPVSLRDCLISSKPVKRSNTPFTKHLVEAGYLLRYSQIADGSYGTDLFVLRTDRTILRVDITNNPNKEDSGTVYNLRPNPNGSDTFISLARKVIDAFADYGRPADAPEFV